MSLYKIKEPAPELKELARIPNKAIAKVKKDVIELIKWKEIFERLEEATDVCEDVSNIIEGSVLKNA